MLEGGRREMGLYVGGEGGEDEGSVEGGRSVGVFFLTRGKERL